MEKSLRYRLFCGCLALMTASVQPMAVFGEESSGTGGQEVLAEGAGTEGQEVSAEGAGTGGQEVSAEGAGTGGQEVLAEGAGTEVDKAAEEAAEREAQIDAFFDGAVFVGDSVMVGYGNYATRRGGPCLGRMQFLAAVSFSVYNALQPITAKSTHPLFMGQKRYVWESLGMMQAKKVFLCFGLNDIDMGPLESTCARYAQVIANIKTYCPEAEIHIMSMTYIRPGREQGRLNNPTVRLFNGMLAQMALENGWGFVNIADPLSDANGDLAAAYCSDGYCHQNNAAYDVWTAVLRDYAGSQIDGTSPFPVNGQTEPKEEEGSGTQEETRSKEGTESQEAEAQEAAGAEAPKVIRRGQTEDEKGPGMPDGE